MYKDKWTQHWPMGSKIYPEVHENPRAFFNSSSPILLEPLAHGFGNWPLPREDCIREGISTPRARHKGWQPLIECAQRDFKIIYFPKSCEMFLLHYFIVFFIFPSRQGCCPCSYISPSAMRKSNLRSSLSLNVCALNWFYVFERFILIANKESLRRWTLKRRFKLWKVDEVVKALNLERSQVIFDEKKFGFVNWFSFHFYLCLLVSSLTKENNLTAQVIGYS